MRKGERVAFVTLMLVLAALPAWAEAAQPGTDAFFDWGYLATYSGAVAAVVFIVQFLKLPIDRIGHVPTRVLVYFVSLAVLLLARLFTAQVFTVKAVVLTALNAMIVAFAAMGMYERVIAMPEAAKNSAPAAERRKAQGDAEAARPREIEDAGPGAGKGDEAEDAP